MDLATVKPLLYWAGVVFYLVLELRWSYRAPSVSKLRRWLTNLPLSVVNGVVYHLVYGATLVALMAAAETNNLGLLNAVAMPGWLRIALGVIILDFFIWLWHLLTHTVPVLWRFHRVHHCDMNLDISTANRFHIGELLVSGLLRMMVVYSFGIPLSAYLLFEIIVNLSIQFHHSSLKISPAFEKVFGLLFMTPSLHRVHHSVKIRERDSNYGVISTVWDRMFGTLVSVADQAGIIIGIGSHRSFEKLGFWDLLAMPFTRKSL